MTTVIVCKQCDWERESDNSVALAVHGHLHTQATGHDVKLMCFG